MMVPVYDILNCGERRRFSANGKLVHNSMKANMQNLPRIPRDKAGNIIPKRSNALRECLMARPGHKVIVADQSGIELRVNHYLWQVEDSMELYARDATADLYRAFAAVRYAITPEEVTKAQRQLAKVAQLGLGFGAGADTFRVVARVMGGLILDESEAASTVADWRGQYRRIVNGWRVCHEALTDVYLGREREIDPWGLTHTCKEGIVLPSGRTIRYPSLHEEPRDRGRGNEWWYGQGRHRARIYAGKVDENIVQALARDIITDNMLEFRRRTGLSPSLLVHDELVYVVPDAEAEALLAELQSIMRTSPSYWPEIVLWSEGDIGDRYSDAK